MKKLICIFTALLSFFIFYISFSDVSKKEYTDLRHNEYLDQYSESGFTGIELSVNQDSQTTINNIKQFLEENQLVGHVGTITEDGKMSVENVYIYLPDKYIAGDFFTRENKKFDFSQDTKDYYSTNLDDTNAYDYIDFVDVRNNRTYKHIINIFQLNQYPIESKNRMYLYVNLSNNTQLTKLLQNSALSESVGKPPYAFLKIENNEYFEEDNVTTTLQITTMCGISIILLFICQMIKAKKEITLCKMYGMSNIHITKRLYLKHFILCFFIYNAVQAVAYGIFVGHLRPVTYAFIMLLIKFSLTYLFILCCTFFALMIFTKVIGNVNSLKQSGKLKYLISLDFVLKIIIFIVILQPLVVFAQQGSYYIKELYPLLVNKENLTNNIYVASYDITNHSESDNPISNMNSLETICEYFDEQGAQYQDFSSWTEFGVYDIDMPKNNIPFIRVNKNALKNYNIKDSDGNFINIDNITKQTAFVSEKYKNIDATQYCNNDCDIVPIKNAGKLYSSNIKESPLYLNNPIIILETEINGNNNISVENYILKIDNQKVEREFISFLKTNKLDGVINYTNSNGLYNYLIEHDTDALISFIVLISVYVCVISSFLYQNMYVYFLENKQKFAQRYLYGNTFIQRHGDLLLLNLIGYIPIFLFLYFVNHMNIGSILVALGILIIFELLATYVMLRVFERNRIVEIMKGE